MSAMRAVGYFRADADPSDASTSLVEQNRRFIDFCREQGYDVAATFVDEPSEPSDRPGWWQLIAYVRRFTDVTVVVESIDRLGRDSREAARGWFQLAGLNTPLVAIAGAAEDEMAVVIRLWDGREDSERLGDRVRAAMRRKAVKGEVLGRPPYGYRVGIRRRLELAPDEADVVRHIFQLYIHDELGIRLIARRLNEEGYRTRRDGNWSMVTIRDILRNRAYLGTYMRFGVRVPGNHPALVSADDFRKAQERLEARRTGGGPRTVSPFLLSGLAMCGSCAGRMIGVSRRQSWTRRSDGGVSTAEYRYYQCGSRTNQSVCAYHTHRVDALDEQVRQATIDALAAGLAGVAGDMSDNVTLDAPAKLRSRLRVLDRELDRLLNDAATGRLNRARLRPAGIEVALQHLEVEAQLHAAERRREEHTTVAQRRERCEAALERLRDDWDALTLAERGELLRDVLDRVLVYDDRVEPVLRD